jgi:hypothetical protein
MSFRIKNNFYSKNALVALLFFTTLALKLVKIRENSEFSTTTQAFFQSARYLFCFQNALRYSRHYKFLQRWCYNSRSYDWLLDFSHGDQSKVAMVQLHFKGPTRPYIGHKIGIFFFLKKRPPYTLSGFDLSTHTSNLLGGRRRRYH